MSISAAVSVADCLGFDLAVGVAVGVIAVDLAVGLVRCHASPKLLGHRERFFCFIDEFFFAIVARALGSVASCCVCLLALILLSKKAFSSKIVMWWELKALRNANTSEE